MKQSSQNCNTTGHEYILRKYFQMKQSVVVYVILQLLFINAAAGCSGAKFVRYEESLTGQAIMSPGNTNINPKTMNNKPQPSGSGFSPLFADRDNKSDQLDNQKHNNSQNVRLMIYSAELTVLVENISESFQHIKSLADNIGGYMQSMSANSIVVKVPAVKFQEVITEIEKIGQVSNKVIKGNDVTEEIYDLDIRLKNAEELRKRLLNLLDKADKMEDAIKLEQELARVTETIELIKGKIRFYENQIAYSTITVYLNSPLPQLVIKEEIPFEWVRGLADDLSKGNKITYHHIKKGSGIKFTLPKSFAKYYEENYLTLATSAEGVFLKVQRHENSEGADLDFWAALIKRSLSGEKSIYITDIRDIKIKEKIDAKYIEGSKEISGKKFGYLAAVALTKEYVYVYEAWGKSEQFIAEKKAVEESIKTMNISSGFWD